MKHILIALLIALSLAQSLTIAQTVSGDIISLGTVDNPRCGVGYLYRNGSDDRMVVAVPLEPNQSVILVYQ